MAFQGAQLKREVTSCAIGMELPINHALRNQLDDQKDAFEDLFEQFLELFLLFTFSRLVR